jgi:hypothetical protein
MRAGAAAIVARIPRAAAAGAMAAELRTHVTAFERLSEESQADVINGLKRSLRRWWRFLSTGVMPSASEFDPLREWARARASEGILLEDLLWSFGLAHQLGWELLRRHARDDESGALIELAGLLAKYQDRVSAVVTETYLAERELLVSEEERSTRSLLERLCVDSPLEVADRELANRLAVPLDRGYRPFVIVLPERSPRRHAALAARLRLQGHRLAVTQSDRVVGITWQPLELVDLSEGADLLLAIGRETPRSSLRAARDEVAVLAEHGRRLGMRGRLDVDDYLLEILLGCSPELAARVRAKVLAPLAADERGELVRTLRTFVACHFDRTAASVALHVHRNTLAYRLRRIGEITGLDFGSPRDLAHVYLAVGVGDDVTSDDHRAGRA